MISEGEAGAYQYFVNKALPSLGILRSLFRLDNSTFVNGKTSERDGMFRFHSVRVDPER